MFTGKKMRKVDLAGLIAVAAGRAPADLLLRNARVVNTFNGTIETGNVAIIKGTIAGIGDYADARSTIDLRGRYLVPGLIDGHVHIESSMLHPIEYVRAVVPRGVLGVVTDLHEIGNIGGIEAVRTVMGWCSNLPCDFHLTLPSCVPSTDIETSGARITKADLLRARRWKQVVGLGEMMDYQGVARGDDTPIEKMAVFSDSLVDGHAPRASGMDLNAYIAAGARSDHECTTLEEAREKLARGMYLMIREGSTEKNLDALLPLVDENTYPRCLLVTDDRGCVDLMDTGDVDDLVRRAISRGIGPVRAIQMATINPAIYFGLKGKGAIAPGYAANLFVTDDLVKLEADEVFYSGALVARDKRMVVDLPRVKTGELRRSVIILPLSPDKLSIKSSGEKYPVIGVVPGQIVTRKLLETVQISDGMVQASAERDILKLAVVERHRANGNVGLGLVKGFGLKYGALASSVSHDSHNIVVVGCNDQDMLCAIREIERMQGGLAVCRDGQVVSSMGLPIAGLMTDKPLHEAAREFSLVERAATQQGTMLPAPFAALSFLALPVIPALRLTDKGLVEVSESGNIMQATHCPA